MEFLERRRLPRTRGAAQVNREIARIEQELDHLLLLRPKPVGSNEIAMPTQRFKMPKPSVDSLNHFLFPIQACARGHFVAGPENGASRLLNHEMAFQFSEANVTTAVTQGLGE